MQKPTAILAAVLAVSIPVVVATSSQAADTGATTPTSTATSTTPTSPYVPQATPVPTPKPTAVPTPAPIAPGIVLTAVQKSVEQALATVKYADILKGKTTITIAVPGAGTYIVTLSFRKPGKKYRSFAKGAVSVPTAGGTTVSIPVKPNSYAPSTARYAKHMKKVKIKANISYELGNRTVQFEETILLSK